MLLSLLQEFHPHYVVAAFDEAAVTFRKEMFADYKATRKKEPDDLYAQVPRIREVLGVFRIPILSQPGFEGDDIIGTLTTQLADSDEVEEIIVVSGDLDVLQLVTKKVKVYTTRQKFSDTILYDVQAVKDRYGFSPQFLVDYKGLRGDPSDNIPGVEGVGEKTAQKLIQRFSTLEALYESIEKGDDVGVSDRFVRLLQDQKDEAFFSKKLATIHTQVPFESSLEQSEWGGFRVKEIQRLFRELRFDRAFGCFGQSCRHPRGARADTCSVSYRCFASGVARGL